MAYEQREASEIMQLLPGVTLMRLKNGRIVWLEELYVKVLREQRWRGARKR